MTNPYKAPATIEGTHDTTIWHLLIYCFATAFAVLPAWWHLQIERAEWVTKQREIDLKELRH